MYNLIAHANEHIHHYNDFLVDFEKKLYKAYSTSAAIHFFYGKKFQSLLSTTFFKQNCQKQNNNSPTPILSGVFHLNTRKPYLN